MFKWLHHLFNPHCPDCEVHCKSCETLLQQLEIERQRNNLLLDRVTGRNQVSIPVADNTPEEDFKPIRTSKRRFQPYAARQQIMEQQDLKTLNTLQERWREIHSKTEVGPSNEKLEQELLGTDILANASEKVS